MLGLKLGLRLESDRVLVLGARVVYFLSALGSFAFDELLSILSGLVIFNGPSRVSFNGVVLFGVITTQHSYTRSLHLLGYYKTLTWLRVYGT